jgi:predicted Zn-dependent protease
MRATALILAAALAAGSGCRTASERQDEELGRDVVARVRAERTIVVDPAVADPVRELARPLVRAAGPQPFRFRLYVVSDASDVTFSAPGGHVFVHTGAIEEARDARELAALLAHEIGHAALGHAVQGLERERGAAHREGSKEARGMRRLGSSREDVMRAIFAHRQWSDEQELAADRFALRALSEAGDCPAALGAVLDRRASVAGGADAARAGRRLAALAPELGALAPCGGR